jgi:hypothetical protein
MQSELFGHRADPPEIADRFVPTRSVSAWAEVGIARRETAVAERIKERNRMGVTSK